VTAIGKIFVIVCIVVGVGIFVASFAFLSHVEIKKLTAELPDNTDAQTKGPNEGKT
jgi:CBS domain containing-hemolysin-like protein